MSDELVDAALVLADYQLGRLHKLTGPVEDAMLTLHTHLCQKPMGSDLLRILADEVRRLRDEKGGSHE